MRAKFQNFGTKTNLSAKQASKLSEIIGSTGSVTYSQTEKSKVTNEAWARSPRPSPRQKGSATRGGTPNLAVVRNTIGQSHSPKRYWRKKRTTSFFGREFYWFKRRLLRGLVILSVLGLLIAGSGLLNYLTGGSTDRAAPRYYTSELSKRDFSVTDGDTIQIHSESKGTRLIGFNTPETFKPSCEQELALGKQATARLKQLVASAQTIEIEKRRCACRAGTEGTNKCNYGRSCGVLRTDGADVGEILVAEGLAAPFRCGRTSCPRLPRPWCN